MKRLLNTLAIAAFLAASPLLAAPPKPAPPTHTPPAPPAIPTVTSPKVNYAMANAYPIGGDGGSDLITVDPEGKTLFVPRMHRVVVMDAATGKVNAEIGPGVGMCSIALVPASGGGRGFISHSKENLVSVFDLKTYAILGKIPVPDEPGNLIYDDASKKILICTAKNLLLPMSPDVDLKNPKFDTPVELPDRADSLVADGAGMVYATIKEKDQVAVVDTRVMRLATAWTITGWYRPSGISMDRLRSRLFVSCKTRVVVLSATDGHVMDDVNLGPGVEGTAFYDGKAFATNAEGMLAVIGQNAEGKFSIEQKIDTAVAVKTVSVNPRTGTLYLPAAEMNGHKVVPNSFRVVTLEKK